MTEPTSMPQGLIQLMDHSLDFVEILGADGVVEGVSAAFQRLSGYGPRDFVGRQYKSLVHPEDQARAEEALSRALHGTEPETVKLRYRKKDGLWRTILASEMCIRDRSNSPSRPPARRSAPSNPFIEERQP